MENRKPTFYQRLNKFFGADTSISADYTRKNVNKYNINNPNVIFATKDKSEYDAKALELKQNRWLNWRWKKANIQLSNQQYMNISDVKMMYRDADLMDGFPEFGTAADILAEEACYTPSNNMMVNVFSKSERIKAILEDLLYNRLQIKMTLPMIARCGIKYGNCFMLHDIDLNNGVRGWRQLPVYEVERYENMTSDNQFYTYFQNQSSVDLDKEGATRFVWIGENEFTPYWNWQISHFRLLYDSIFLPYGCITGDSKIETEYGFKDMRNVKIGDKVWTFNTETQKRELATVSMQMNKGIKEVYRIGTFHNDIVATSDHKFLIYDGELKYKELDDIEIGDLLVIDNLSERNYKEIPIDKSYPREGECNLDKNMNWWKNYSQFIPDYVDEEFAHFFGFMLGDGWITYGRYVFFATGEYSSMNNEFKQYLEKITGKEARFVKPKNKSENNYEFSQVVVCSKSLSLILKRMGFDGRFNEKRIPDWVFSASTSIKKAFLNGLMAADGSYNIDKYNILRCQLEVANEGLVRDAKCLAQSLGYKTSKVNYRNRIGKTAELGSGRKIVIKHESYYFYYYESQNMQEKKYDLKNRKGYGFKTEKVRVKEFVGERETYDITVDNDNSNFFANGIVTHNCSFFNKARRHFRMLSMMEDAMLMYRLERAIERRVFKVNVGSIDEDDVQGYVEDVANEFKRTPIVDPLTGQLDLRKNLMPVWRNTPIPLIDGRVITIEELAKEYEGGKENYVYSVQDETHQVVPGKVVWCGKNYTAEKMVKVTLDDGGTVYLAPEHEFIMRDGSKKRADKIYIGDSVMPFYTETTDEDGMTVFNPSTGKYVPLITCISNEVSKHDEMNYSFSGVHGGIAFDDNVYSAMRNQVEQHNVNSIYEMEEYLNASMIEYIRTINGLDIDYFVNCDTIEEHIISLGFVNPDDYFKAMQKNHHVIDVEYVDGDDVYCMSVLGLNGEDDRHNFALLGYDVEQDRFGKMTGCFVSNCYDEDIFVPVRDPNEPNPVETLQAGQNLTALDDIKYVLNKILIALRIPKAFLNFEETAGDGKNLSLMDVRFMRTVNRVQQMLLLELNKVCIIHLAILGFTDDLTNFTLTMNNPSSQAEMLEIENLAKKITTAKDAITDGGNGIPLYSCIRAWKEIMGWSDKEISDNLEEIRLESALAAELQKTTQIIKRTGLFDKVDNVYGEPGATYNDSGDNGEGEEGEMPGGGGGGSIGGFGGDMDMGGAPEGEDVEGSEGDMPMDQAADEAAGGAPEGDNADVNGGGMGMLAESVLNRKLRELDNRKKALDRDIMDKSKKYSDLLIRKVNEKKEREETELENIPLFNKSFFVNEELNNMSKHLELYIDEHKKQ